MAEEAEATDSAPQPRDPPEFSESASDFSGSTWADIIRGHEVATMGTEDATTLGVSTSDGGSQKVYNQDWDLSFTRDRLEKQFWRRLQKRIRLSNVAFFCAFALIILFLLVTQWETTAEEGNQQRNTLTAIFAVIIFIMALVELVMWARQNEEDRIDRYLKVSSASLVILAACVSLLNHENRTDRRSSSLDDSCRNGFIVKPSSQQWLLLFCRRSLFSTHIDFMAFAALRRISFKSCVVLAVFNVLCTIIFILAVPYETEPVMGAYQVIHTLIYTLFICFVRYLVERAERQHFIAVDALERSVQELRTRREQLLAAVEALLPRHFIDRSSATSSGKLKAEDVSKNATVLVMGIHDFTMFSSSLMPMEVVRAVDDFVSIVSQHLDLHKLDKIWVHQDEIMAVGNLLLRKSTYGGESRSVASAALIAWQLAVGESNVNAGAGEAKRIPIRAAVDVGEIRGKFTGSRRIRYDVSGDAVEQARTVLLFAEANQALITARGLDTIPGAVAADTDAMITAAGSTGEIQCVAIKAVTIEESMWEDKTNPEDSSETSGLGNFSISSGHPAGSPTNGTEEGLLMRTVAFANEKSFAAPESESNISSTAPMVRSGEKLVPTWCCFAEYEDPEVEEAYRQERMKALPQRGSNALFGLAACHGLYLILTAMDIGDPKQDQAGGAVVLIVIAILIEIAVAMYARCANTSSLAAHHTAWSAAAVLSPLLALYGFALSRPALVGLDISYLVLIAAMARSPCFVRAKHQLVAIPLLLIAGQISMVLPGGSLTFQNVLVWMLSMFLILVDRDLDAAQRSAFEANRVVSLVQKSLLEEQEIRSGLLENAVPRKIMGALEELNAGERVIMRRPDSVQMVISQKPNVVLGESEVASAHRYLFAAIDSTEYIDVCDIFGDSVVVAGPILGSLRGAKPPEDAALLEAWHMLRALFLAADTTASSVFDALVDIDSTIQLLRNRFPPTFTVQGPALRMLQSVRSLVDRGAQSGLLATNRLVNVLQAHSEVDSSEYEECPKDPWRVRGLGILRFIELRRKPAGNAQVPN